MMSDMTQRQFVVVDPLEKRMLLTAAPVFKVQSLVSDDTTAVPATNQDGHLVNAWGLAAGPPTAWWVANNGTGTSTLYDGDGNPESLVVTVPGHDGKPA